MKAATKDIFREVKKSGMRFFYISSIIALGVAFFCGIKATSPSMIKTALDYFSQTNLSDFRLVSTYGIRDEDIKKLEKIDGVESVSGGYSSDQIFTIDDDDYVIKILSIPQLDGQNTPNLREGRFPVTDNECVFEYQNTKTPSVQIGDTLTLKNDPDRTIPLHSRTFTVVGYVETPQFISLEHGNTNIGAGEVEAFLMVTPGAFDIERYTEAYIYTDISAQGTDPYSDEYSKAQETMISSLENVGDEILDDNIYDIKIDALNELAKSQQEYDSNKSTFDREIAQAQQKLEEGKKQLEDGYRQYYEGLDTFNTEIANAQNQLNSAQDQLDEGYAQYESGQKEMQNQIGQGLHQLEEGRNQLNSGLLQYNNGLLEFNTQIGLAQRQLTDAKTQLETGYLQYQQGLNEFNTKISEAQQQLEAAQKQYDDGFKQFTEQENTFNTQIAEAQKQLDAGFEEYQQALDQFNQKKEEFETQIENAQNQLDEQKQILEQSQQELDYAKAQYEEQLKQYEQAISQFPDPSLIPDELKQMKEELDKAKLQIDQSEEEIAQGKLQLEQGQEQLDQQKEQGQEELDKGETQLTESFATLNQQQEILNQNKQEGEKALDEARQDLAEAKAAIDLGQQELTQQVTTGKNELDNVRQTLQNAQLELEKGISELGTRQNEGANQLESSRIQLENAANELRVGEQNLAQQRTLAENQLNDAYNELVSGANEIEQGRIVLRNQRIVGENQLRDSLNLLIDSQNQLNSGESELETQRREGQEKLDDAKNQLDDARQKINDLDRGEWFVYSRSDNPGYTSYQEDTDRIDNIGNVFPLFFFLVAALVAFTTMTRMVEEERTQIGTLYALGFSKWQILKKFIVYSGSAAIIGATVGWILGVLLLPNMIFTAYNILYNMPEMTLDIPWNIVIISYIISIFCTVGAATIIALSELRNVPAELMRPKAPKPGKRILLERIPLIWNRLNFISKVSVRNIFRYKARFFMTTIGIAGCTALILAGFGLHDAIFTIIPNQFGIVFKYDQSLVLTEAKTDLGKEVSDLLKDERVSAAMAADQQSVDVQTPSGSTVSTTLVVPEDSINFPTFISLHERTNRDEPIPLTDQGVVVSEKLATNYGANPGETVKLNINNKWVNAVVSAQTENYLRNFVYMSPGYYKKITGEEPKYSTIFVNFSEKVQSGDDEAKFAEDMIAKDTYVSTVTTSSIIDSSEKMLNSLNIIVVVMIVSAGMLAFIVLNNLTNINISERVREIATLKVLGFRTKETNNYIFRENIILSIIGMIFGLFLGVLLLKYIIFTVELDIIMFGREIKLASYFYSILLTLGFTIIVNFTMIPVINRVNMVESLKDLD